MVKNIHNKLGLSRNFFVYTHRFFQMKIRWGGHNSFTQKLAKTDNFHSFIIGIINSQFSFSIFLAKGNKKRHLKYGA